MKKTLYFSIVLLLSLTGFHCKSNNEMPTNSEPTLVWKEKMLIGNDSVKVFSHPASLQGDILIYTSRFADNKERIHARNAKTGTHLWTFTLNRELFSGHNSIVYVGNTLFANTNYDIFAIDIQTGKELWHLNSDSVDPQFFYSGELYKGEKYIYFPMFHHDFLEDDKDSRLYRLNPTTAKVEKVFTVNGHGQTAFINGGIEYIDENKDTNLLFQDRSFGWFHGGGQIDLYYYNVTKKIVNWKLENIDATGNSASGPAYIYNNKVYFLGDRSVMCFNQKDGKKIWENFMPGNDHLSYGRLHFYDNMVLVKPMPAEDVTLAYDINTGQTIWTCPQTGSAPYDIIEKNGIIYTSTNEGFTYAINLKSGTRLWQFPKEIKMEKDRYNACPLVIDKANDLMYLFNGREVFCYKLPKI